MSSTYGCSGAPGSWRRDHEAISFQLLTRSNKNAPASFPFSVRNTRCLPCTLTVLALTCCCALLLSRTRKVLFGMRQYAPKKKPRPKPGQFLELFVRIIRLAVEACISFGQRISPANFSRSRTSASSSRAKPERTAFVAPTYH
jgi:hypothetical protein